MRALPGPAPAPRKTSSCGRSAVHETAIIPLALFPGVPAVVMFILLYLMFGWEGIVGPLAGLATLAVFYIQGKRKEAEDLQDRITLAAMLGAMEEEQRGRVSPTVVNVTVSDLPRQALEGPGRDVFITEDGTPVFYDRT